MVLSFIRCNICKYGCPNTLKHHKWVFLITNDVLMLKYLHLKFAEIWDTENAVCGRISTFSMTEPPMLASDWKMVLCKPIVVFGLAPAKKRKSTETCENDLYSLYLVFHHHIIFSLVNTIRWAAYLPLRSISYMWGRYDTPRGRGPGGGGGRLKLYLTHPRLNIICLLKAKSRLVFTFPGCSRLCSGCSRLCSRCSRLCYMCSRLCYRCSRLCYRCSRLCYRCSSLCYMCSRLWSVKS